MITGNSLTAINQSLTPPATKATVAEVELCGSSDAITADHQTLTKVEGDSCQIDFLYATAHLSMAN